MTIKVGYRELARNAKILDGYDYVEVEDKKTHEYKGLFVSPKYAAEIKQFLDARISQEIKEQLAEMQTFAGAIESEDRYKDLEADALKTEIAKAKVGE